MELCTIRPFQFSRLRLQTAHISLAPEGLVHILQENPPGIAKNRLWKREVTFSDEAFAIAQPDLREAETGRGNVFTRIDAN